MRELRSKIFLRYLLSFFHSCAGSKCNRRMQSEAQEGNTNTRRSRRKGFTTGHIFSYVEMMVHHRVVHKRILMDSVYGLGGVLIIVVLYGCLWRVKEYPVLRARQIIAFFESKDAYSICFLIVGEHQKRKNHGRKRHRMSDHSYCYVFVRRQLFPERRKRWCPGSE